LTERGRRAERLATSFDRPRIGSVEQGPRLVVLFEQRSEAVPSPSELCGVERGREGRERKLDLGGNEWIGKQAMGQGSPNL
jgi:hypothetical protein